MSILSSALIGKHPCSPEALDVDRPPFLTQHKCMRKEQTTTSKINHELCSAKPFDTKDSSAVFVNTPRRTTTCHNICGIAQMQSVLSEKHRLHLVASPDLLASFALERFRDCLSTKKPRFCAQNCIQRQHNKRNLAHGTHDTNVNSERQLS